MRSDRNRVHVMLVLAAVGTAGAPALAQTGGAGSGSSGRGVPSSASATGGTGASGSTSATGGASATGGTSADPAPPGASLPPEDEPLPPIPPPVVRPVQPPRPPWGHRGQVGLRLGVAYGGGIAIRYGNGDQCNARGNTFCGMGGPMMLDGAIALGVAETLEIEARIRFGLAATVADTSQWNGENPVAGGLGIRYYGTDQSPFKFAFGVAVFADFTGRGTFSSYGTDIQARLEEGVHYDVGRNFAAFFQLGETIGFVRALSFSIDAGLGIQVRVP